MNEDITFTSDADKSIRYAEIIPQIKHLISGETNLIANLSNITAVLKSVFNFYWVGFYLVDGTQLVLGPFQGTLACTRIPKGRGVCGVSWEKKETLIVPDVLKFAGHIACSSLSKSEIVVPMIQNDDVIGVLDVDSEHLATFDTTDAKYLKDIVDIIISNK